MVKFKAFVKITSFFCVFRYTTKRKYGTINQYIVDKYIHPHVQAEESGLKSAKDIVSSLTLEQKSRLVSGVGQWHTYDVDGKIPQIMMTDGPHGLRKQSDKASVNDSVRATCFPTAATLASGWSRQNVADVARAIAEEAVYQNVSVVLGPGINVKRSPLCGRNFEYFSEDPFLAGELGVSYVTSMQRAGVGCCLKHFAANSQEYFRMINSSVVDERALREIYLSAFEKVVKVAKPYSIMAAYNKINGVSCTENKTLLTDILRDEWGFDGLVMSDWGAVYHKAQTINAGCDLEMPDGGKISRKRLVEAVKQGEVKQAALDRACQNVVKLVQMCEANHQNEWKAVLRQIYSYGEQDKTQLVSDYDSYGNQVASDIADIARDSEFAVAKYEQLLARHHALAKKIAAESAVLLKNDGILPLSKDAKVLVVGKLANAPRYQGAGSSHVNAVCPNVSSWTDVNFTYCDVDVTSVTSSWQNAATLASQADVVLFFGGLTDSDEGEGYDRENLDVPGNARFASYMEQANKNLVFVGFGGSPYSVDKVATFARAAVHFGLGGEAVIEAVKDVLFGDVNPSGRLAETYPQDIADTPCFGNFATSKYVTEYRESIFVGYRYYDAFNVPVAYPFGYGLSYTNFNYKNLHVSKQADCVSVSVDVTNVGNRDGAEVVQLYVENCPCGVFRAKKELKGFDKIFLKVGETRTVRFTLDKRAFSVYSDGGFVAVNGTYGIAFFRDANTPIVSHSVKIGFGVDLHVDEKNLYPAYFGIRTDSKTELPVLYESEQLLSQDETDQKFPLEQFVALLLNKNPDVPLGAEKRAEWCIKHLAEVAPQRGCFSLTSTFAEMKGKVSLIGFIEKIIKKRALKDSSTKSENDPVYKMIYNGAMQTPLVSLPSMGGVPARVVAFILNHANKRPFKAFMNLIFGCDK